MALGVAPGTQAAMSSASMALLVTRWMILRRSCSVWFGLLVGVGGLGWPGFDVMRMEKEV